MSLSRVEWIFSRTGVGRRGRGLLPRWLALLFLLRVSSAFAHGPGPAASSPTNAASLAPVVSYLTNFISFYEPTYFIAGSYPSVEFQFSVKSQLFYSTNQSLWPLSDFYFGYTQTSFWDLFTKSPSFYDTSYKPSGFMYFQDVLPGKEDKRFRLDLQGGLEHESNGRGDVEERSFNTAYFQPTMTFLEPDGWRFSLQPRAWVYVLGVGDNNRDIAKFHGYTDLLTTVSWTRDGRLNWNERYEMATMFHIGSEGNRASVKVDLSFSLFEYFRFTPRLHAQYFAGYEQTLRQYNQFSTGYRIGISLFD